MTFKFNRLLQMVCVAIIWCACEEVIEPAEPMDGISYFPLKVGNEWVYQQSDIAFEISGFDTTEYIVREQVIDVDTLSATVQRFILERSIKSTSTDVWQIDSRYSIKQSNEWVLTQSGNQTLTTLSFPIQDDKRWDYNSHNTSSASLVKYQTDTSMLSGQSSFADLMLEAESMYVIISDIERNIVNQNQQHELYVKGVGMIEKKSLVLEFCTVNCDSAGQINTGYFSLKQLITYDVD